MRVIAAHSSIGEMLGASASMLCTKLCIWQRERKPNRGLCLLQLERGALAR